MDRGTSIYFHYNSPQEPAQWVAKFLEAVDKLGLRLSEKYPFHIVKESWEQISDPAKVIASFPEVTSWHAVFVDPATSTEFRCSASEATICPDGIFGFQVDISEALHPYQIDSAEREGAWEAPVLQYDRMKSLFWEMEADWAWAWFLGDYLDPFAIRDYCIFRFTRHGPQKLVLPLELHKFQEDVEYNEWEIELPLSFEEIMRGEAVRWITSKIENKIDAPPPPVKHEYEPILEPDRSHGQSAATSLIVLSPSSEQVLADIQNESLKSLATNLSRFLGALRLHSDLWILSLQQNEPLSFELEDAAFPELAAWALEPVLELARKSPEQCIYFAITAQGWMEGARLGFERDYFDFSEFKQASTLPELFARIFRIGFEEICHLRPDEVDRLPNLLFTYFDQETVGGLGPLQKLEDSELHWYRSGYLIGFLTEQILMVGRSQVCRSDMATLHLVQAVIEVLQRAKQKRLILFESLNEHDSAAAWVLNSNMLRFSNKILSRQTLWRVPKMIDEKLGHSSCPGCTARRAKRAGLDY